MDTKTLQKILAFVFVWGMTATIIVFVIGIYGWLSNQIIANPIYGSSIWIGLAITIIVAVSKKKKRRRRKKKTKIEE